MFLLHAVLDIWQVMAMTSTPPTPTPTKTTIDDDDPEEADDEETSFDEDRFCRQVLKIQEKAFARFSVLPHRQRKLLNRLQKTTT